MTKAKITKNLIPILSAIISVIFAFIIGYTYCYNIMKFEYGLNKQSTQAYLGNKQYVLINDVEQSPILYSPGSHPTEISLQYAIDYEFDLRVAYTLDWVGDEGLDEQLSTSNVELLFANRDNVIVDDKYIYYINYSEQNTPVGLPAGSGEISLISGVEIVDSANENYLHKTLKITIDDIKIYKANTEYDESDPFYDYEHPLCADMYHEIVTKNGIEQGYADGKETVIRESAEAWLTHKTSVTSEMSDAYVMVYNHRYNNDMGVSSPGHNSAYGKSVASGSSTITASWLGGNRAYAGIGLYVITGSKPLTLKSKVSGTWRNISDTSIQQFDNNIRFNYSADWVGNTYDSRYLFEIKDYNYIIPAYTACYISIVDSVEITTAGDYNVADLDTYRLVVSEIQLNDSASATFRYDGEDYDAKITSATITCPTIDENDNRDYYSQKSVTIVNSSKYANNLYEFVYNDESAQYYNNDKLILINNTPTKQEVEVSYGINFYISNGSVELTKNVVVDGNTVKVKAENFTDSAYFRADKNVANEITAGKEITYSVPGTNGKKTYTLAPYASVAIQSSYSLDDDFQTYISSNFGGFDAWVELDASIDYDTSSSAISDLLVEIGLNGTNGTVRVKNASNDVVTSISATVTLNAYKHIVANSASTATTAPNDWQAKFWTYYKYNSTTKIYEQNQSKTWIQNELFSSSYSTVAISLTEISSGNVYANGNYTCSNKTVDLKPNESIDLLSFTFAKDANDKVLSTELLLQASASADTADLLTATTDGTTLKYPVYVVTKGVDNYYLVNNSNASYFVRFTESSASGETLTNVIKDGSYYYYTSIVRPGQILRTTSKIDDVEVVVAPDVYTPEFLTDKGWGTKTENGNNVTYSEIVTNFNNIFGIN